jgi:hypothetical protein
MHQTRRFGYRIFRENEYHFVLEMNEMGEASQVRKMQFAMGAEPQILSGEKQGSPVQPASGASKQSGGPEFSTSYPCGILSNLRQ